jgi:hypothetical protein
MKMRLTALHAMTIFLLYACAPVYVPNARNVPMLTKRGEVFASGSMGSAGTNVQVAVAVTDHFAIAASGHYANNSIKREWRYREHRAAEIGLGYFQKKGKSNFEIFGGVAQGNGYARDSTFEFFFAASVPKITSGDYTRFFIQPAFGLSGRFVEGALTSRFSALAFSSLNYSLNNVSEPISKRPRLFFEPAFTFRAYPGGNNMFISYQVGAAIFLDGRNDNDDDPFFEFSPFQTSIGIGIRFGKKTDASTK